MANEFDPATEMAKFDRLLGKIRRSAYAMAFGAFLLGLGLGYFLWH